MKIEKNTIQKYVRRYYKDLANYARLNQTSENTTEMAFKTLLKNIGDEIELVLIKPYQSLYDNKKIIPDGILTTNYGRYVGFWEAKDTEDNLDEEIYKKLQKGYPRTNTIFEDNRNAVLYQDNLEIGRYNLQDEDQLIDLLLLFFNYNEPILSEFKQAIQKFKENIPRLADSLQEKVKIAKAENTDFQQGLKEFLTVCTASFQTAIQAKDIEDMLIQHLLTERIFRKIFDNPDFVNRNAIAVLLEKLVQALTQQAFSRTDFFKEIDFFYKVIEEESAKIDSDIEKQSFLNSIYELFFQSYSKKNADKNGIVYTPQAAVRFMVHFSNQILQKEFGKTLADKGITIIDPCVGTGNFIIEVLKNIASNPKKLAEKYENEIFCNEIMLLPYYIACVNIEYFYFQQTGKYKPFRNIVFADSLELIEKPETKAGETFELFIMNLVNTERAQRELDTNLFVVIGNPPYNASQTSENDNNKNNKNEVIDQKVKETYAKDSKAQLRNKLYDPYVKFFRWASERLNKENGLVCFITNNSFMTDLQFDGMRKHLMQDFQRIYHINLGGDIYSNPKLNGKKHNIFGIKVGVGITFLVRNKKYKDSQIFVYDLEKEDFTKEEKYKILDRAVAISPDYTDFKKSNLPNFNDLAQIPELKLFKGFLNPQNRFDLGKENIENSQQFQQFIPLFDKDGEGIFEQKYPAINTARTDWVYDFNKEKLFKKLKISINFYNSEVKRLANFLKSKAYDSSRFYLDHFVNYDDKKLKWSASLKARLKQLKKVKLDAKKVVFGLYRPFVKKYLYYDKNFIERPSAIGKLLTFGNIFININGLGVSKDASCVVTNLHPDYGLMSSSQAFPLYKVIENQKESNITAWALQKFGKPENDIFYYVYGIFHHQNFRKTYSKILQNAAPRIPFLENDFAKISEIGKSLADLHLNFENAKEFEAEVRINRNVIGFENPENKVLYAIRKMKIKDNVLIYNHFIEIILPDQVHEYKVNGRSPVQWIVDQYEDFETDSEEIIVLIKKLIAVSLESLECLKKLSEIKILENLKPISF